MERHDIDDELSTPGAQHLLASPSTAHLAYTGEDGTPRVRYYDFGGGRMPRFLQELAERNPS